MRLRNGLRRYGLGLVVVVGAIALLLFSGRPLVVFLSDQQRLQDWLTQLGPWAPLAVLAINALQIVVAPLPAYFAQLAEGYLFGATLGTLLGVVGMLLGGTLATALSRRFGRPIVVHSIGQERLEQWEDFIYADSPWTWFVLFLLPIGDIPWFLAGLSQIPVWQVALVGFVSRAPSVYVVSAIGAGQTPFAGPPLIALVLVTAGLTFASFHYRHRLRDIIVPRFHRFLPKRRGHTDDV